MDIFIYDTHISIHKTAEASSLQLDHQEIHFNEEVTTIPSTLKEKVILHTPSLETIQLFIQAIVDQKYPDLEQCIITTNDKKTYKKGIKSMFYTLKAAGGLVTNQNNEYLLIYRLAKWDLPKGKAEKGETSEITAIREVEEECSVSVKLEEFICATWHYYPQRGKQMLKKTDWYAMECTDDSNLQPQTIEDIEKVEWVGKPQLNTALANTYHSIKFVFDRYFEQAKKK